MWNFHGSLFLFGLGISKGSSKLANTILCNIQGLSFVLSGDSRDKVKKKKEKFQGSFHNSISSILIFSGIAHSKICLHHGGATDK